MQRIYQLFKTFGPGLIMASSAIGGSHIIASTQAGANYGFQLAGFIIAVNLLKYPFYYFAFRYSLESNQSILQGYADKGSAYLSLFLIFNSFATVVNVAGGTLLSAALLAPLLPISLSLTALSIIILISFLLLLSRQQYAVLDFMSKNIMLILTVVTMIAFAMALYASWNNSSPVVTESVMSSPWTIAGIPFLIALMGWMPSPLELSVASSLWVIEKKQRDNTSVSNGLLDFNVGYIVTVALALVFMGLGALVQYGKGAPLAAGGKYIMQFVDMYAFAIGEWTRWFVGLLAFICIYGTTITAVEGYSRTNMTAVNLLTKRTNPNRHDIIFWILGASIIALVIILFFRGSVKHMIPFAMTMSFISAPIFAWLNFSVYKKHRSNMSPLMFNWALLGIVYLLMMLILYVIVKFI